MNQTWLLAILNISNKLHKALLEFHMKDKNPVQDQWTEIDKKTQGRDNKPCQQLHHQFISFVKQRIFYQKKKKKVLFYKG